MMRQHSATPCNQNTHQSVEPTIKQSSNRTLKQHSKPIQIFTVEKMASHLKYSICDQCAFHSENKNENLLLCVGINTKFSCTHDYFQPKMMNKFPKWKMPTQSGYTTNWCCVCSTFYQFAYEKFPYSLFIRLFC